MTTQNTAYGISTTVNLPFERALARTREALAAEGFRVLTEIDVAGTLKKKLDIGLLLPCNVIVYAADDPGHSVIAALDPVAALSLTGNEAVQPIADEVRGRLQRVLVSISNGGL